MVLDGGRWEGEGVGVSKCWHFIQHCKMGKCEEKVV